MVLFNTMGALVFFLVSKVRAAHVRLGSLFWVSSSIEVSY